jgi:hypothetical protein
MAFCYRAATNYSEPNHTALPNGGQKRITGERRKIFSARRRIDSQRVAIRPSKSDGKMICRGRVLVNQRGTRHDGHLPARVAINNLDGRPEGFIGSHDAPAWRIRTDLFSRRLKTQTKRTASYSFCRWDAHNDSIGLGGGRDGNRSNAMGFKSHEQQKAGGQFQYL